MELMISTIMSQAWMSERVKQVKIDSTVFGLPSRSRLEIERSIFVDHVHLIVDSQQSRVV